MKCINISCLGARFVISWRNYGLKQGIPWHFFCFFLFLYNLTQRGSVENIVLYHKNRIKNNNSMAYGGGYLWICGVLFCGVCGGGVGVEAST